MNISAENDQTKKIKLSKEERSVKEKELLLVKLAANNLKDIRSRVAFILNHYPETRNSDILLAYKYWEIFQSEYYGNGSIDQAKMFKLERQTSLSRARAKIQNEYGLFLADKEVRSRRMGLKEKEKEEQLADKPGVPSVTFYLDESSKNQKFVIVGGLCCTDGRRMWQMSGHLAKWKLENNIKYEFHFKELDRNKLDKYKDFVVEALGFSDTVSFKAVALNQRGIKGETINQILCKLYYQIIHLGMEHEVKTKRASLPREVTIFKDKEEGSALFMVTLEQDLEAGFKKYFNEQLRLQTLKEVESSQNLLIQLADLYIGSISRILNREEGTETNHKDEFAEYFVSLLKLNINEGELTEKDMAFVRCLF
jgi:hypothetical protein